MDKKTLLLLLIAVGLIVGVLVWFFNPKKSILLTPQTNQQETNAQISPSKTLKSYTDPAGFTFSYPDNLSLVNNEPKDDSVYADIQLTATGVDGNLALKIADSKLASLDEWVKLNKSASQTPKEVKLGNLKALEVTTSDKLLLGALDQGILFNIEGLFGSRKDFWVEVYNKILAEFTFAPPSPDNSASGGGGGVSSSSEDITFEGEEVIE